MATEPQYWAEVSGHSPLANLGGQDLTQLTKIFVDTPVVGSITFPMDG